MAAWLYGRVKGISGCTAVIADSSGLHGVTLLPPATPGGKPRVVRCGSVPGGSLDAESVAALAKLISVPGCSWNFTLSRGDYSLLVVQKPQVAKGELEQSVRWSIGDKIESPVDEGTLAVMEIPTDEPQPNRAHNLYVAFAENEIVDRCNSIFRDAGITLDSIDIRETAQRNLAALCEPSSKGLGLLYDSKEGVQFTITCNGALYLDRFIEEAPSNQDHFGDAAAERSFERIVTQLQRSVDVVARTLSFIRMDRIEVLSADSSRLANTENLATYLQTPVQPLDLNSLFDFSKTPGLAEKEAQIACFSALGAALRFMENGEQINLMPPKVLTGFAAVRQEALALGAIMLALLGIWGVRQMDISSERKTETILQAELQSAQQRLQHQQTNPGKALTDEINLLMPRAEAAGRLLDQAGNLGNPRGYSGTFSLLASIGEQDLWLTSISISNAGKTIGLSGRALRKESVLRYVQRLNDVFGDVGVRFNTLTLSAETSGGQQGFRLPSLAFQIN